AIFFYNHQSRPAHSPCLPPFFRRTVVFAIMNIRICSIICGVLIHGITSRLPAAGNSAPAASNVPGAQYPRVDADLRVTFRIKAPSAQKVEVKPGGDGLGKSPFPMTKSDDGTWE